VANFTTKTIKEIFDTFISKYTVLKSKYGDSSPILKKSFINTLGYAIGGIAANIWQLSVWIYKQCFPQTCELPALKFWGGLIDVNYNEGASANLGILLNGVTAPYLVSGTVYKDLNSGLIYKTVSQVNSENGQIKTTVQCTTSGSIGNLPVDTVLNIANPLDGIPSTAVVTEIKIEGTEDEEIETYRRRVLYGFKNKNETGSVKDYVNWALEVSGIADVFPYVLDEGVVTLYIVANGSGLNRTPSGSVTPNPFPKWVNGNFTELEGSGQFLQVAQSIEGTESGVHNRRNVMAGVDLKAPNYTAFDVEINGLTDISYNEDVKNAIIGVLDTKKPNIIVMDYSVANSRINNPELSAACLSVLDGETFTSFVLKNTARSIINEEYLGIGSLAYLRTLKINDDVYYTTETDSTENLTEDTDEQNT
jgi:baseplate J-like protein